MAGFTSSGFVTGETTTKKSRAGFSVFVWARRQEYEDKLKPKYEPLGILEFATPISVILSSRATLKLAASVIKHNFSDYFKNLIKVRKVERISLSKLREYAQLYNAIKHAIGDD